MIRRLSFTQSEMKRLQELQPFGRLYVRKRYYTFSFCFALNFESLAQIILAQSFTLFKFI